MSDDVSDYIPKPMTEERIRRVTIGLTPETNQREGCPWRIRSSMAGTICSGERANQVGPRREVSFHRARGLDVSIGVPAKPIIDILLVVESSADEKSYLPALEAAGYVLGIREPDWHEHRMFKVRTRTSTFTCSARG